ncbi:MAG: TetR/AcrR family transcriptional regulator [Candidatus Melainabacteria bacterium]|jgi:AcrR family transcriptional regulator|nr:TetR/AcrR family transcriptional regulator [Candidatus Melainabacteria bacterium]
MGKGKVTREMILGKAAALFNSRGYFGASMSDVMSATGLEKGGIYNHFLSKDQLALEAFDYAFETASSIFKEKMDQHDKAIDKLIAFVECFKNVASDPPIPGGCPLLNSAVESDDGHPEMKLRVMKAMDAVLATAEKLVSKGIEEGDIEPDANPQALARSFLAGLEGAIMLTRLYSDTQYMDSVAAGIFHQIETLRVKR